MEAAFVRNGYTNWKDTNKNFANHVVGRSTLAPALIYQYKM